MRALLFVILVACGGGGTPAPTTPTQPTPTEQPPAANEEKFTGTITQINFGCAADARCDLTVDGARHVHFGHDTRLQGGATAWGNTEEIYTLMGTPNDGVGRKVEVFAAKQSDNQFTIEGKTDYYIKVLPP